MEKLLSRDAFRTGVFIRDKVKCVICGADAVDAHHIMERRLFPDGGYYLSNGASLCTACHIGAEETLISVEDIRLAAGITKPVIPPHLYDDQPYDKWGNAILTNGTRVRGELFDDESVQKVLRAGDALRLFVGYVKYPRTYHLPFSPGMNSDDRVLENYTGLAGKQVVITKKMDGENTSMYRDYLHARSVDGRNHVSRNWVKNFWSGISADIPEGWRICGENLYAKHSIGYTDLPSYFLGFSIWDQNNVCRPWDETLEWFELIGITRVPIIYTGPFILKKLIDIAATIDIETTEGFVVRTAGEIRYKEFRTNVAKWVRPGHVATTKHWMHGQAIEPNGIRSAK